jgi:cytochrome c oxidase subunit 2
MLFAILWICAAITLAVFGVMLYSVATFRPAPNESVGRRAHNLALEIFWSLIPILIFVSAMLPVVKSLSVLR